MKRIFTHSACLFWALLLAAVFSGGTAVAQEDVLNIDFGTVESATNAESFKLIKLDVTNTTVFETRDGGENGQSAYIIASPGIGSSGDQQYDGLIKLKQAVTFEKGYIYTLSLRARSGENNDNKGKQERSGNITLVTNPDVAFESMTNSTPHGSDKIVTTQGFSPYTFTFETGKILTTASQKFYLGFRLHSPKTNKSYMYVDDIVITRVACNSRNIQAPSATVVSAPSCGSGEVTLRATSNNPNVLTYRWYTSAPTPTEDFVATGTDFVIPRLEETTKYYVTAVTAEGCESEATEVTATINSITFKEEPKLKVEWKEDSEGNPTWEVVADEAIFGSGAFGSNPTFAWYRRISDDVSSNGAWGEPISGVSGNTYTEIDPEQEPQLKAVVFNSETCTQYTLTNIGVVPLPVEIIYFTAAKQGNNVLLEWATASEQNNTGFEVQVSQDGFNFRKLNFVPTKNGNTAIKQVYTFKDTENGKYGTRYYRLKQIDMDGQFEYFTTKAVSFGEVSSYSLQAFPNPFENEVTLELNADEAGKLNVQVLDAMGRAVLAEQYAVSKGRSVEKLTLWQSLPKGIYFVRTEMNGIANNFKLLKK